MNSADPAIDWRHAIELELDSADDGPGSSIAEGLLSGGPVVLYGAGECSHWFVEIAMKMHGCKPAAIIDRKLRAGGIWNGVPTYSPADFGTSATAMDRACAVICVGERATHPEIRKTLTAMGFRNILALHDIYEIHNPFSQPPTLAGEGAGYLRRNRSSILAAFDLLADDLSREIYVRLLQTHARRRPVPIPQRPRNEQYFPHDVPLARGHDCYVCCGAYDGDTVRLLHDVCGKVGTIACFEPEPHIYARLTAYLGTHGSALAERILTWPCAVYGHSGQLPFISGDGLGSRIGETGSALTQCVTLDQALIGLTPTFISMDVEGAEPEVLRGAEQLIRRCTPDLGICVYHSAEHAWSIPLQIAALDAGYRYYLRNYTGFAIETVLYATH